MEVWREVYTWEIGLTILKEKAREKEIVQSSPARIHRSGSWRESGASGVTAEVIRLMVNRRDGGHNMYSRSKRPFYLTLEVKPRNTLIRVHGIKCVRT